MVLLPGPLRLADGHAGGRGLDVGELADVAMEGHVRQLQAELDAGLLDHLVPALNAADGVLDVVVAQHFVERIEHGPVVVHQLAIHDV